MHVQPRRVRRRLLQDRDVVVAVAVEVARAHLLGDVEVPRGHEDPARRPVVVDLVEEQHPQVAAVAVEHDRLVLAGAARPARDEIAGDQELRIADPPTEFGRVVGGPLVVARPDRLQEPHGRRRVVRLEAAVELHDLVAAVAREVARSEEERGAEVEELARVEGPVGQAPPPVRAGQRDDGGEVVASVAVEVADRDRHVCAAAEDAHGDDAVADGLDVVVDHRGRIDGEHDVLGDHRPFGRAVAVEVTQAEAPDLFESGQRRQVVGAGRRCDGQRGEQRGRRRWRRLSGPSREPTIGSRCSMVWSRRSWASLRRVTARAADAAIDPWAPDQPVASGVADQPITSRPADEAIVASVADQAVPTRPADQPVSTRPAHEAIAPGATDHPIVAAAGTDRVGAATGPDDVGTVGAEDDVVAVGGFVTEAQVDGHHSAGTAQRRQDRRVLDQQVGHAAEEPDGRLLARSPRDRRGRRD